MSRRALELLAIVASVSACSPNVASERRSSREPALTLASSGDELANAELVSTAQELGAQLPSYRLHRPQGPDRGEGVLFVARNPAARFVTDFTTRGPRISAATGAWSVALTTERIECSSAPHKALARRDPLEQGANKISYRVTEGLDEWYVNGPLGLEQGFTLAEAPCGSADDLISIQIAVDGLIAQPSSRPSARQQIELAASDGSVALEYSNLLAIDAGKRVLPSAMAVRDGNIELTVDLRGATFPVIVDPLVTSQQTLAPSNPENNGGDFGGSIAIDGNTAIIGMPSDFPNGVDIAGSAYVFVRNGLVWSEQQKLVPSTLYFGGQFGLSVAISGNTALIGAQHDNFNGAAYVFVRSGTTWQQQRKIVAADGEQSDLFGSSVALSGDTALIGASADAVGANAAQGSAYVYVRSGTTWPLQQKLVAADGATNDRFGNVVALDGDTALIGAYQDDVGANLNQGSVRVFVRSGTTWSPQQTLTAMDGAANAAFGKAVSLDGQTAAIEQYVFVRSGVSWSQQQKLVAPEVIDGFGFSNSIFGDTLTVGAKGNYTTVNGAAFTFLRSGTTWTERGKLVGPPQYWRYAEAVATGPESVLVGAPNEVGVAIAFSVVGGSCDSEDDCLAGHCVDGVCCNAACNGACDACTQALGAVADGFCTVLPQGSAGNPACAPLACTGASATCSACSTDSQCPSNRYCAAGGSCQLRKATGTPCDVAAGADCNVAGCHACTTPYCVDGFCCDQPCNAHGCLACANSMTNVANGTCAPVPAGFDPKNVCAVGAETCLADGTCDGAGDCNDFASADTPCGVTSCDNATVTGYLCTGGGACEINQQSCGDYQCNMDRKACGTSCAADAECTSNAYCAGGLGCQPKKTIGSDCGEARECSSGHCADGVCCNSDCLGQCQACAEPSTVGTCTNILGDPRGDRPSCGAASCGAGGLHTFRCEANAACGEHVESCGLYACAGAACGTSCDDDTDCGTSGYCASPSCEPKLPTKESCNDDSQCTSGHCADGVCCTTACMGQCEACNEDGTEGTCTAVQGSPRGSRPACGTGNGVDPCGAANCDGEIASRCAGFVGSEVVCGAASCADGVATNEARCDGSSTCPDATHSDCGAYACAGDVCGATCVSDGDCQAAFRCDIAEGCVGRETTSCLDDGLTQRNPDGSRKECSPYVCFGNACRNSCTGSGDCAPGFACNPVSGLCEPADGSSSVDDGGCGCRLSSTRGPSNLTALSGLFVLALLARKRRNRVG